MKLGVLLDHLWPATGGAEAHTRALLRRALAVGDEVLLATIDGRGPTGTTTLEIDVPRRRPARDRAFAEIGIRRLRDEGAECVLAFRHAPGCDVYLPHGGLVTDALDARDLSRSRSAARARFLRALSPRVRYFLDAERALLGGEDGPRVVCVSRQLAARIATVHPAAAPRLVVVPNGVDAVRFDPAPFQEAGRETRARIGLPEHAYVGLLMAHHPLLKGARTSVEALARPEVRALETPCHLVVVGGALPRSLRRRAAALGVGDRVHEVGPVDDPRPFYAAADVLVHPTFHDPCSLACLEAMAMARPVITTPPNGVRELLGSRGGIVIERPGDPEALAIALRVLADPDLRGVTADDARYVALRHREATRLDQVLEVCRDHAGGRLAT